MPVVQYHIANGINCLFELPTETARKMLPKGVEPIEPNHGTSLLGITMFDFNESPVGPYQELVLSLYVVPVMGIMEKHPHAAVYPLVVASSHQKARDHAIELWHLPHFMEDIRIEFAESPIEKSISATVYCHQGQPIVGLKMRESGTWSHTYQLYQSFQRDKSGNYIGVMDMAGLLSEHDENTGTLNLHEHRFFDQLNIASIDPIPFREMWMKSGVESYHDLLSV